MIRLVNNLGGTVIAAVEDLGRISVFGAQIVGNALRPPIRTRLIVKEIYKLGVQSLSIIGISGLAVGMVLGLQGYNTLVRFGATGALGGVVGLGLIRELGPVLTGLLVTGRAGSATTAEIGTMVASEQLDGLRMMSINPIHLIVVPRALALLIVMPLLSAIFTTLGIFGGFLVGVVLMGIDAGAYLSNLEVSVLFHEDVVGSLVKSTVFGALLGLISTYKGVTSAPNSAGVSAATTQTVVIASVSVLVFDYIITAFLSTIWGY